MSMRLLPQSGAERIRFGIIAVVFFCVCGYYRLDRVSGYFLSSKREGDILFQSLPRADLVDAIETVSESEWSHCGVLFRNDGRWVVAEAFGEVRYTPLFLWILRGRSSRTVSYRHDALDASAVPRLKAEIEELMGRQYDFRYAPGDDEIYCSELVEIGYKRALSIELGTWQALGDLNWRPKEAFIREMEDGALPLGRLMVTPVSIVRDPQLRRVH